MTIDYDFSIQNARISNDFLRNYCYLCIVNQVLLHISYLLCHHDCVVVPGLGAFLNYRHGAWIDENTLDFHAPSVSVGFNPEIDYNDWMIADSISRRDGISREAAMKQINDEVKALRYQLETDREVSLGEIGLLRFNGGVTPEFLPSVNVNDSYSGLSTLHLNDPEESSGSQSAGIDNVTDRRSSVLSGFIRVAACFVAILMAATFFLHIPATDDNSDVHFAAIDSGLSAYTLADALWGNTPPPAPELLIASHKVTAGTEISAKDIVSQNNQVSVARLDVNDPYLVIVASFSSYSQAEKFISQHSGSNLEIVAADGNYRIFAASARSLSEAMASSESAELREHFPNAWVLRQ